MGSEKGKRGGYQTTTVQRPEVAPPESQWPSAIEREIHPDGHGGGGAPPRDPAKSSSAPWQ